MLEPYGFIYGQTTLGLIKPEAYEYGERPAEILEMVTGAGLTIINRGTLVANESWVDAHYFEQAGKPHFQLLMDQFVGCQALVYLAQGENAVERHRLLTGDFHLDERPKYPDAIRTRYMRSDDPYHRNFNHSSSDDDRAAIETFFVRHWLPRLK